MNQPVVDRKHNRSLAALPYQYAIHAAELLVPVVVDIGPDRLTDPDVTRDPPARDLRLEDEVPLVTVAVAVWLGAFVTVCPKLLDELPG